MNKAQNLHFLIHPDFSLQDENQSDHSSDAKKEHHNLHVENVRSLADDEIVAIFLDVTKARLLKKTKESAAILSLLRDMRLALGKRLVVLSGDWKIFEEHGHEKLALTMDILKKLFKQRGYEFDVNTPTTAYGESLLSCVVDGANALNGAGLFRQETMIIPSLTDYRDWNAQDLAVKIRKLLNEDRHDCIKFQNMDFSSD